MGTSQYDIQKRQLEAQAKETRRRAGEYQEEGMEQARLITQESTAALSKTVSLLGKAGALGVESEAVDLEGIETGVKVGATEGKAATDLRTKIEKQQADLSTMSETEEVESRGGEDTKIVSNSAYLKLQKDISEDEGMLAKLTKGLEDVGEVEAGEAAKLTTGTTALNLKTFQDKLEAARNKYVNQVQEDVYSAIMSAESAEAQAVLAGKADKWATISKIGGTIGGGIIGFAMGGPAGAAKGALVGYGAGRGGF